METLPKPGKWPSTKLTFTPTGSIGMLSVLKCPNSIIKCPNSIIKCPNSIIIPCKFRFIDEKIKLKFNQWDFSQHSQSHPKKTNFHLCLVLSTSSQSVGGYRLPLLNLINPTFAINNQKMVCKEFQQLLFRVDQQRG